MRLSIATPRRLLNKVRLVSPYTLLSLKGRNAFSQKKLKIGFGPIKSGEKDINVRKWRIDPIVHYINERKTEYVADFFFDGDCLDRFDIIVIVKVYGDQLANEVKRQRSRDCLVVFDIVDNPLGCKRSIYDDNDFVTALDGLILSSPEQKKLLDKHCLPSVLIEHPVINPTHKSSYEETDRELKLLWQGFAHNAGGMQRLENVVREIAANTRRRLKVTYHTNAPASDDGFVQYIPWTIENAFQVLTEVDIAIGVRDENRRWQEEKPSTKTIMYMAAGLPVVCSPTSADRLVIQNGITGYFASTPDEWSDHLSRLVLDRELRERVGRAARQHVLKAFSVPNIGEKYLEFFAELRKKRMVS